MHFQRYVSILHNDIVNTRVSLYVTVIVDFSSACDLFEKMRTTRWVRVERVPWMKILLPRLLREMGETPMRMNIDRLRMQFFRIRFTSFVPAFLYNTPRGVMHTPACHWWRNKTDIAIHIYIVIYIRWKMWETAGDNVCWARNSNSFQKIYSVE